MREKANAEKGKASADAVISVANTENAREQNSILHSQKQTAEALATTAKAAALVDVTQSKYLLELLKTEPGKTAFQVGQGAKWFNPFIQGVSSARAAARKN